MPYYHRDALGSITEVSNSAGTIVERYEYDVYGEVTIYDASDTEITASAIGNPYLFTARRYDAESGNYYYRARYYSHELGRFLSQDPLGFGAGDYNLYRYVFNNPINATDPTGEFAFLPWLLKASTEAAVDALMQGVINYYFDPGITTVQGAIESIDLRQVGIAFISGLLPGSRAFRSGVAATGDVLINYLDALSRCEVYTPGQALRDFAINLGVEFFGDRVGDLVAKYGPDMVKQGFRKLGFDELIERLSHHADDVLANALDNFFKKVKPGRNSDIGEIAGSISDAEAYFRSIIKPETIRPHPNPKWSNGGYVAETVDGIQIYFRPGSTSGGPVIDFDDLFKVGRSVWKKVHFVE